MGKDMDADTDMDMITEPEVPGSDNPIAIERTGGRVVARTGELP
jgi:hypothetical protein